MQGVQAACEGMVDQRTNSQTLSKSDSLVTFTDVRPMYHGDPMGNDRDPLEQYIISASQEAFAELVRQNANLVYAAARRQVRDPHLAEDITQAVFGLLAKKARDIRGPLVGWLVKTTWYASQNARRLQTIRRHHERQVAEMNSRRLETTDAPGWDDYCEVLDDAMARLQTPDRDAICLRFLQGLDLPEVATALGISPDAARKRVERSLEKLRKILSAKAAVPASAILGAQLAAEGSIAAPASLVASITSSGGVIVNGSLAGTIASGVSRTLVWIKVKIAAAIVLAASVAGGGAGMATHLLAGPAATPAAAADTTKNAMPQQTVPAGAQTAEMRIPGEMQLVRWDVILDDAGAALVSELGRPVESKSHVYIPRICSGEELRNAVAQALDDPQPPRVSRRPMQFADFARGSESNWGMGQLYFNYESDAQAQPRTLYGASPDYADSFIRTDSNHMAIKINHPKLSVGVTEQAYENPIVPPGQAMLYDGQLTAGEALAFLASLPGRSGQNYHHLVVWETFKAQPEQFSLIQAQHNAGWWCKNGPQTLRAWADAARLWMADTRNNPSRSYLDKKLDDGTTVCLNALSRPSKWPSCWWDPQGKPVGLIALPTSADGQPTDGLYAILEIQKTNEQMQEDFRRPPAQPSEKARVYENSAQQISESGSIEVGIPIGGWEEIARVKIGQSVVAEGVTFSVENTGGGFVDDKGIFHDAQFVDFKRTGRINDQYTLVVVAKDGTRSNASRYFERAPLKWGRDTISGTLTDSICIQPLPSDREMPVAQRDYGIVMRRKRQWVTFDGFATNPSSTPPTNVSTTQANAKEAQLRQAQEEQLKRNRIAANREHRKSWEAITPDPKTHLGCLKVLVQTAQAGDTAGVREMLSMPEPKSDELLSRMARLLVLSESIRAKVNATFGPDAADGDLDLWDFGPVLASMKWTRSDDGSYRLEYPEYTLRPGPDGRFLLQINYWDRDRVTALKNMVTACEKLDQLLGKNPPPSLEQVKAVLRSAMSR